MRLRRKRDRGPSEATLARQKAERDLERVRAETQNYRALGRALREMVEENHLAQALTDAIRGNR